MGSENKDAKVLAGGAVALSTAALITALTRKAKAAPEDEVVKEALATLLTLAEGTQAKSDAIIKALESLDMEVPMEKKVEQIPFTFNLAALQGVTLEEPAPFAGYIKEVNIHWPGGCNALVDVMVGHNIKQFCPREGYLALNDVTPTYLFNVEVKEGDVIWVEIRNTDGVNPHNITVTVMLEGTG